MEKPVRILHLEDDNNDAELVVSKLKASGLIFDLTRVQSQDELESAIAGSAFDLIISDYAGPRFSGAAALALMKEKIPEVPFIFVSATMGEDVAVESLQNGATDYVLKTGRLARLGAAVERALREVDERRERLKLEAQYRQAQKMEAIGRLAGGVAHDFNNLLTVILGLSEFNIGRLPADSAVKKDFEEIAATALRASELTKQLLTFSRKQLVSPKVIDLNDVLKNVEKLLKRVIGEDIELVFKPSRGLSVVRIDPGQMEQLLVNLAVNARDAMPSGGRLTVETADAALDREFARLHPDAPIGDFVSLTVRDTGSGMTAEVMACIFEPFFTTKGHGTGLGLATCYGIAKQNGGYIGVDSAVGQGTVFTVYLPRTSGAPEAVGKKLEGERRVEGAETIIVVEDEDSVRKLIARILRDRRYTILEACGVEEALCLVEEDKAGLIRLVITDVVMPKSDGKQCADKLRALRPDLRFLFVSGYSDEAISHHGVLDSGLAFLPKPFTADALSRKVREILDAP